jgi:hypothetical protein
LVDSDFFGPRFKTHSFCLISAHDVFAARFHEPMTTYKDMCSIARIGESANANLGRWRKAKEEWRMTNRSTR